MQGSDNVNCRARTHLDLEQLVVGARLLPRDGHLRLELEHLRREVRARGGGLVVRDTAPRQGNGQGGLRQVLVARLDEHSTWAARSAFWSVKTPRRSFIPSFSAARSWFSRVNWLSLMFSYMTR
jgi:hypothetical protein